MPMFFLNCSFLFINIPLSFIYPRRNIYYIYIYIYIEIEREREESVVERDVQIENNITKIHK